MGDTLDNVIKILITMILVSIMVMIVIYMTGYQVPFLNSRGSNKSNTSNAQKTAITNASSTEDKVKRVQQLIEEANYHSDLAQAVIDKVQLTESVYEEQIKNMEIAEENINLAMDKVAEAVRLLEVQTNSNSTSTERFNAAPDLSTLVETLKLAVLDLNEKVRTVQKVVKDKRVKLDEITKVVKDIQKNTNLQSEDIYGQMVSIHANLVKLSNDLVGYSHPIQVAKNTADLNKLEDIRKNMTVAYNSIIVDYQNLLVLENEVYDLKNQVITNKVIELMSDAKTRMNIAGFSLDELKLSNTTALAVSKGSIMEQAMSLYQEFGNLSIKMEDNYGVALATQSLSAMIVLHADSNNLVEKEKRIKDDIYKLIPYNSQVSGLYDKVKVQLEYDESLLTKLGHLHTSLEKSIATTQNLKLQTSINIVNDAILKLRITTEDLSQMQKEGDVLLAQTVGSLKNTNSNVKIDSIIIQADALNTRAQVAVQSSAVLHQKVIDSIGLDAGYPEMRPLISTMDSLLADINKRSDSILSILPSVKNFQREALQNQRDTLIANIQYAYSQVEKHMLDIEYHNSVVQKAYDEANVAVLESKVDFIKAKLQIVENMISASQKSYNLLLEHSGKLDGFYLALPTLNSSIVQEFNAIQLLQSYSGLKSKAYNLLTSTINVKIGTNGLEEMIENITSARIQALHNMATTKLGDIEQQINLLSNALTSITQNRRNSNAMRNAMNTNSLGKLDVSVEALAESSIRYQQIVELRCSEIQERLSTETEPSLVELKAYASNQLDDSVLLLNSIITLREEINGIYDETQIAKKAYVLNQAQTMSNKILVLYQQAVSIKKQSDLNRHTVDVSVSNLDLPTMRQLEIDHASMYSTMIAIQNQISEQYTQLRNYVVSYPYLELGDIMMASKSMHDDTSNLTLDILRVKEYISTQMVELKDLYINQSIVDVNKQINLMELTYNKIVSLLGQSELILGNVVAVVQTSDVESSLVYVRKQIAPFNVIVVDSQKVLNELYAIRTKLEGLKLTAESELGPNEEIRALVERQLLKYPAAEFQVNSIYNNYVAILACENDLIKKLETLQNAIADATNQLTLLQNNYIVIQTAHLDMQVMHDDVLGVYNMPVANWEYIINSLPQIEPKMTQANSYLQNAKYIYTLIGRILYGFQNATVKQILSQSDDAWNNVQITWHKMDKLMADVYKWHADAVLVNNMKMILESQTPKVSIVLQSYSAGEHIKNQAMTYYSTYEWDRIDDEIQNLQSYLDTNDILIDDVNIIHQNLVQMSNDSIPASNIIKKSNDNLSQMEVVQFSLASDLEEIKNRTAVAQQMATREVNYAQVIVDNSTMVHNLMNSALNDVYALNDVIQKATTAGRQKNQTLVQQYYNQSLNLMSTMTQKRNNLGSVVEDSRTIMNQYIRDVPVNVQSAYDSLENDAQSMNSILVSAQQMQTKWKQIYTSAGMIYS